MLITEKELIDQIRLTRPTIVRLRKQGMPHIKLERAVRYDLEDVIGWLKERSDKRGLDKD